MKKNLEYFAGGVLVIIGIINYLLASPVIGLLEVILGMQFVFEAEKQE